jgi:hypothetical protein
VDGLHERAGTQNSTAEEVLDRVELELLGNDSAQSPP